MSIMDDIWDENSELSRSMRETARLETEALMRAGQIRYEMRKRRRRREAITVVVCLVVIVNVMAALAAFA